MFVLLAVSNSPNESGESLCLLFSRGKYLYLVTTAHLFSKMSFLKNIEMLLPLY